MDQYVTGAIIKKLREKKGMTQAELSRLINVSDKTVSKWETAKGYPDITLLEPLSKALDVSVMELLSGSGITNTNRSSNILRSKLYVCPVCGNVLWSTGEAVISCHGIVLLPLEADTPDESHKINISVVEDEYYVTIDHDMTKEHYISFIAGVSDNGIQIIKMYPEWNAEAHLKISRTQTILFFCNKDGLFKVKV